MSSGGSARSPRPNTPGSATGGAGHGPEGAWEQRWIAHALLREDGWPLLRRPGRCLGGRWDIRGGIVEAGEIPAVAARREVREETGLRVEIGAVVVPHERGHREAPHPVPHRDVPRGGD
ncbi:NUDIX hydrolase [Actinopolyspora xinjiangensis]|uniref:NUDIX hydrolase n=1 Tax=Actinopolyspora xinjiangensis TaxID=405564 RepID=UPI000B8599D4|nr:NUDIX hydrolase [Actinopolyspora xinjiangensis]